MNGTIINITPKASKVYRVVLEMDEHELYHLRSGTAQLLTDNEYWLGRAVEVQDRQVFRELQFQLARLVQS